jgi:hypothetical protein
MYQLLFLLTPRLSSLPEPVKDPATETTGHNTAQNRLLSALEAFYYCIVLLGGGANFMNKQAVGLDPPYPWKPQTPEEKTAVAARKVQRAVKKRLLREAVAARVAARKVKRGVKKEQTRRLRYEARKATAKETKLREAKKQKKRAVEEYELEWEACWGGSTLSKRCRLPPAPPPNSSSSSSSSAAPPGMGLR